jgi:hypothetical protein
MTEKGSDAASKRSGYARVKISKLAALFRHGDSYRDALRHSATASLEGRGGTADPLIAAFARVPLTAGHPYIRGYIQDMYPRLYRLIGRKGALRLVNWSRADSRSHQRPITILLNC